MHTIRLWLVDDDCRIIKRLAAGLGRKSARARAYLALQADREANLATRLEIRISSNLNQNVVPEALEKLEEYYLLPETTISNDSRGRPPKMWRPVGVLDELTRQTYDKHAVALLRRTDTLYCRADAISAKAVNGTDRNPGAKAAITLGLNWRPAGLYTPFYAARCGPLRRTEGSKLGGVPTRRSKLLLPRTPSCRPVSSGRSSDRGVRQERDSPQSRPGISYGRYVVLAQNCTPGGGPLRGEA